MTKKHIVVKSSDSFKIEEEYHRLHQELLKLKREGRYPKNLRFTETMVQRVVVALGVEEVEKLSYIEFEKIYKQLKKKWIFKYHSYYYYPREGNCDTTKKLLTVTKKNPLERSQIITGGLLWLGWDVLIVKVMIKWLVGVRKNRYR